VCHALAFEPSTIYAVWCKNSVGLRVDKKASQAWGREFNPRFPLDKKARFVIDWAPLLARDINRSAPRDSFRPDGRME
jgi:hypothetical protein